VPVAEVTRAPGEVEPLESVQAAMPGPVGSAQLKLVATVWSTA